MSAEATHTQEMTKGPNFDLIDAATHEKLTQLAAEIREALQNTDPKMPEADKDKIFGETRAKWNEYAAAVKGADFKFIVNKDQFEYLLNVLETQLSYGVDEIFVAMQLREAFLETLAPAKGRKVPVVQTMTKDTMLLLYHTIAKHRVKGMGPTAQHFAAILHAIGAISKVFNFYDQESKHLSSDIENWAAAVTPEDTIQAPAPGADPQNGNA
jgi:hypothetical protein